MSDFFKTVGVNVDHVPEATPLVEQARQVTKGPEANKMHYTPRDHDCLGLIIEHPVDGSEYTFLGESITSTPRYCEVSNSKLAKLLGMTAGAAAARVSRLVKMGVVKPWYEVAVETGKVNRRVLEILQVPPTPWSPD